MAEARIIKRYANRKLYDTQHSRYVTLDQISDMIRAGDEVKIVNNKTKEDLTSVTLAQIIFEEEKKQKSFLPLQAMRNIIQTGGESITQLVTEAQKRVTTAFRRGEDGELIVDQGEPAGEQRPSEPVHHQHRQVKSMREFREWILHSQKTIDDWQRKVDDRIRNVVDGLSPFAGLQNDVRNLAERIAELEAKLEEIASEEADASAERDYESDLAQKSKPTDAV